MRTTANCFVLSPKAAQRRAAERQLAGVYASAFGADLPALPPTMVVWRNEHGEIGAGAGLRWRPETFFLTCYLSQPLASCLPPTSDHSSPRMVEVCHLGAWNAGAGGPFVEGIIDLCLGAGADWALFTATSPLRRLLRNLKVPFLPLEAAQPGRIADAQRWGRYYDFDPWVCAVGRDALTPQTMAPTTGTILVPSGRQSPVQGPLARPRTIQQGGAPLC